MDDDIIQMDDNSEQTSNPSLLSPNDFYIDFMTFFPEIYASVIIPLIFIHFGI